MESPYNSTCQIATATLMSTININIVVAVVILFHSNEQSKSRQFSKEL